MKTILFKVDGMKCGGCKSKIENSFAEISEISKTEVNLDDKTVLVEMDSAFSPMKCKSEIEELGFNVMGMEKK